MSSVLIIGAGGVGNVVAQKLAQLPDVFTDIWLASRTLARCDEIAARCQSPVRTAQVDAGNVPELVALIRRVQPALVLHVALPYQDIAIMEACLEAGVHYVDTANFESLEVARFEYGQQWAFHERYRDRGIMGLLGSGFDPGVTNVYCAYAQKHLFDEIHYVDIVDCNGGDHGHAFATNFNPEINIREITQNGKYWENGAWVETTPQELHQPFDFPGIGVREMYLIYHEELESLVRFVKGLKRIRFWMTFGEEYLTHLRVLQNVGMTRIDAVEYEGRRIVPLQFLKAVLPDPGSLSENYTGRTCIGCVLEGVKDGAAKKVFIYNNCDHAAAHREVAAQAVSYTTGVPAMIGAKLVLTGAWREPGVFNIEHLDPDPFMEDLNRHGLPWKVEPCTASI